MSPHDPLIPEPPILVSKASIIVTGQGYFLGISLVAGPGKLRRKPNQKSPALAAGL